MVHVMIGTANVSLTVFSRRARASQAAYAYEFPCFLFCVYDKWQHKDVVIFIVFTI